MIDRICWNCRYWRQSWSETYKRWSWSYCHHPKAPKVKICQSVITGEVMVKDAAETPFDWNKDMACPNYKRKWYKRWMWWINDKGDE